MRNEKANKKTFIVIHTILTFILLVAAGIFIRRMVLQSTDLKGISFQGMKIG